MNSNPNPTQTGSSAADLPDFSAATDSVRDFADTLGVQLGKIHNLPALQDGAQWVQLSTRVDGHENRLTDVQGTVTVTQGDVTTLQGDVTTLQGHFTALRDEVTTLGGNVSGMEQNMSRFQGDMRGLREDFRAFGEQLLQLSRQMRSLSDSIDSETTRLTNFKRNQAEVNIRLEA
ncbi:hypothetical protein E4U28_000524, partial [Claviceps purpurea]